MTLNKKIKTINNKIQHNKAQYNLDRQTAKISTLLIEIVGKNNFLTGEYLLTEKRLLVS